MKKQVIGSLGIACLVTGCGAAGHIVAIETSVNPIGEIPAVARMAAPVPSTTVPVPVTVKPTEPRLVITHPLLIQHPTTTIPNVSPVTIPHVPEQSCPGEVWVAVPGVCSPVDWFTDPYGHCVIEDTYTANKDGWMGCKPNQ